MPANCRDKPEAMHRIGFDLEKHSRMSYNRMGFIKMTPCRFRIFPAPITGIGNES